MLATACTRGQGGDWRQFREQVELAGDNVYLQEWWRCMNELEGFGWLTNGGVHMDLPAHRRNSEPLLQTLGGYIDNCIIPLRRMYAWGVVSYNSDSVIEIGQEARV